MPHVIQWTCLWALKLSKNSFPSFSHLPSVPTTLAIKSLLQLIINALLKSLFHLSIIEHVRHNGFVTEPPNRRSTIANPYCFGGLAIVVSQDLDLIGATGYHLT
ncbi:hypothetical protein K7432_005361 [Basidiobolus ranarum]|uniref:Uncharacterized protein n=1 Tax=Basidiobolus ranarum TaxID=34480 RepID=A0ABR2WWS3_9FUNG